jgi:hypothetical protein
MLIPSPQILNPSPQFLRRKPQTLNPKLESQRKAACQRCFNLCSREAGVAVAGAPGQYFCTQMCADLAGGSVSLDGGRQLSAAQPISDGGSSSGSRQLSATQPISGLSLDGGRKLCATQPISGLTLDGGRQLSAAQPISDGGSISGAGVVGGGGEGQGVAVGVHSPLVGTHACTTLNSEP